MAVTAFAIYVITGNLLTASKAFVALALFNVMRFPLVMLPSVIVSCVQVFQVLNPHLLLFSFLISNSHQQNDPQQNDPLNVRDPV